MEEAGDFLSKCEAILTAEYFEGELAELVRRPAVTRQHAIAFLVQVQDSPEFGGWMEDEVERFLNMPEAWQRKFFMKTWLLLIREIFQTLVIFGSGFLIGRLWP